MRGGSRGRAPPGYFNRVYAYHPFLLGIPNSSVLIVPVTVFLICRLGVFAFGGHGYCIGFSTGSDIVWGGPAGLGAVSHACVECTIPKVPDTL